MGGEGHTVTVIQLY